MEKYLWDLLEYFDEKYPNHVSEEKLIEKKLKRVMIEALYTGIIVPTSGNTYAVTNEGLKLLVSLRTKNVLEKVEKSTNKLNKNIVNFNESSKRASQRIFFLTIVIGVLTIVLISQNAAMISLIKITTNESIKQTELSQETYKVTTEEKEISKEQKICDHVDNKIEWYEREFKEHNKYICSRYLNSNNSKLNNKYLENATRERQKNNNCTLALEYLNKINDTDMCVYVKFEVTEAKAIHVTSASIFLTSFIVLVIIMMGVYLLKTKKSAMSIAYHTCRIRRKKKK